MLPTETDPLAVLLAGSSPAREALASALRRAAASHRTLVVGPVGAGHGRVARALHGWSAWRGAAGFGGSPPEGAATEPNEVPFTELRGEAPQTPERLLAGDLRGTVVLRRVDRLPTEVQAELTRALVGPSRWTRLVATLEGERDSDPRGDLDPDLDYQLGVTCVELPALAERREDLPAMARAALELAALESGRPVRVLAPATLERLRELPLLGELEELELHLRLASLAEGRRSLEPSDLGLGATPPGAALGRTLAEVEREHVESILRAAQGNRSKAARLLGINRSTLYNKLRSWSAPA